MKVATFYAEPATLPPKVQQKCAGFDWHAAIRALERTARKNLGAETVLVTDGTTSVQRTAIRVGNAKAEGIMLWLLDAQAAAIRALDGELLLVSPDTLIAGPLDMLFGDWDVCLLTRARPKPIINSVISVRASPAVAEVWERIAGAARALSMESRAWGADIDALVDAFDVKPLEDATRDVQGLRVRLLPINGIFQSAMPGAQPLPTPIWDFKGAKKALMPAYSALL